MNEPMTLKRPKPGDGEEELFRMQEEFLKSRQEPSAKVVNLRAASKPRKDNPSDDVATGSTKAVGKIVSKFAQRKALRAREKNSASSSGETKTDLDEFPTENRTGESSFDPAENSPANTSSVVLGSIVEKKYIGRASRAPISRISASDGREKGFPDVFLVDRKPSSGASGSLFMQKVLRESKSSGVSKITAPSATSGISRPAISKESLKEEIHQENLEKLSQMTTEEIIRARSQLETTLSPDLLKFLKSRKASAQKMSVESIHSKPSKMETVETESSRSEEFNARMEFDVESVERETPVGFLAEEASARGWMNMDTIEPEKLEWMKDVARTKIDDPPPDEPYNARFDFKGILLPFRDDSLSVDKGLHHHGEEPERPGYSLQELLQLCRSSTQQQRCTALTTLANIMEKSRNGWYDKVLSPSPLVALSERNILLLLRFSLDDTSVAVVASTLQALRAFLYSEADEICLDRLVGWRYHDGKIVEPELSAPKSELGETADLKDHELAQFDTVAAAMRSDIVLRIRYILSEMQPPPIGVTASLEILTRLARQSRTTALNIACTPRLLDTVVRNFIPLSSDRSTYEDGTRNAYGVPTATAVRLCRVLVSYAGQPVADRLNNLQIVHSLMSYTTSTTTIRLRLAIESLRLWKLLLSHNVALESIGGARLAFVSQLQLLLCNHDLGSSSELLCEHAAALMDIAVHDDSLRSNISALLTKWSTQLSSITSPTWCQTKLVAQALTAAGVVSPFNFSWASNTKLFENLCSTSNLLSGCRPASERDPSSLPSLGVLTRNGQPQPIVSRQSCIPFLATCINAQTSTSDKSSLQAALKNLDLIKYLRRLSCNEWNLESSWYTRPELYLVTGIVRAVNRLGDLVNVHVQELALRIAIKLVSTLPGDACTAVREILRSILSNDRLKLEKLSNDLDSLKLDAKIGQTSNREIIQSSDQEIIESISSTQLPNDTSSMYEEFVSSSGSWDQAAMPKDWLYLPLVAAYTDHKNKLEWNDDYTTKIVALLSLELSMPELSMDLSPSIRFSRLILICLCDTIYLNENVSVLLMKATTSILKKYHRKLDFSSDLPGLGSFTDLFTSLCENFCANSYGNDVFSMVLLVPIAQRHDVHYRKLLWSEHAGALRYLRLTVEKLVVPLEEYLYPVEEDSSLIESYLTALVRGTVKRNWCPLMYKIAIHHSAMFIRGESRLAVRMRTKIGELPDRELSDALLNYSPSSFSDVN